MTRTKSTPEEIQKRAAELVAELEEWWAALAEATKSGDGIRDAVAVEAGRAALRQWRGDPRNGLTVRRVRRAIWRLNWVRRQPQHLWPELASELEGQENRRTLNYDDALSGIPASAWERAISAWRGVKEPPPRGRSRKYRWHHVVFELLTAGEDRSGRPLTRCKSAGTLRKSYLLAEGKVHS